MPTAEEIERRVAEHDRSRSAQRAALATRVGDLAQQRAAIAAHLREVEQELGDVLAEATAVMDIAELARFTDVPAPDLTRWFNGRKPQRTKRKKPASGSAGTKTPASPSSSVARALGTGDSSASRDERGDHNGTASDVPRIPAEAT
ncbi:hypothetical protein [Amycolatopsis sp. NPDC058986]|uniref:hypothetical protein n=1 Tax=unclassified Amycolatopsis TaxID=2618356 RepID=UPI00366FB60F